MKTVAAVLFACVLPTMMGGCALVSLVEYHVPIVQGNVVSDKEVKQLHIGMTPPQVQYLLGTPLVHSDIDTNHWDYVFTYRDPDGNRRQSALSLVFQDGKLESITGDKSYHSLLPEQHNEINPNTIIAPNG